MELVLISLLGSSWISLCQSVFVFVALSKATYHISLQHIYAHICRYLYTYTFLLTLLIIVGYPISVLGCGLSVVGCRMSDVYAVVASFVEHIIIIIYRY